MKKYIHIIILSITITIISACGNSEKKKQEAAQAQANAAVPVSVYKVVEDNLVGTDTYPGTVVPLNVVELRSQVTGYITRIYVKEGELVRKGQALYEIDQSKYKAAYQQAVASLRSAEASYQKALKDADRYKALAEKDAIAKQRVDYALTDLETAKSVVNASKAEVNSVATDLAYATIRAPFNGRIGLTQVRLGSQVSPGTTLLNTISAEDPVAVDFVINDKDIPRFTDIKKLNTTTTDSLFTLSFIDKSKYEYEGKLVTLDRAVDPQTGTIKVRLIFPNPNKNLIAGMSCIVNVKNENIGTQPIVPYKAVTEQMGEFFVYVINVDNKVSQRKIEMGNIINGIAVITKGLKKGESIAVDGIQKLREGVTVKTETGSKNNTKSASKTAG